MTATMKRSDATRQALLRAARDEFAQHGLAGARVDRIADAAGVNKERIYGLFGSKDKLFDVILIDTLREFIDVVKPLADTEPGAYVGKLYDYHRDNPQLLRLMLWEALHRGADAHDIDGWRAAHYVRKFDRAQEQFDVDSANAGRLLLALCGLANWSLAVPQTTKLLLGEAAAEDGNATRAFLMEFARAAMRRDTAAGEREARLPEVELVNDLTADDEPSGVDRAAQRLRDAQAAADAAREELAIALRAAHAAGASANHLARQVSGTLSRPVVLRLLSQPEP
ncbi:TetR/AcrR family transcriptional regulator [Nocardia sp. NPDC059691]|uniref:TetR/AcrR family transcriptional regulator n=1 Tax=Nocardia sp. NPDC059691 TaxID=3346908 RepID=UPI0036B53AB4